MSVARKRGTARATYVAPMKALGTDSMPEGGAAQWISEIKFDGYRAIAVINDGDGALWSRNHKPLVYPELIPSLQKLRCRNAVLDGEIVALAPPGQSSFQTLQGRDIGERPPIVYYVFDLIHVNGRSLLDATLEQRRAALEKLLRNPGGALRLSPVFEQDPARVFAGAKAKGLEGIILKRRGSRYESGRRSGAWRKLKHVNEQEFVIGGYTSPQNSREHFGAILVGYYDRGRLLYAGKVGTGFNRALLGSLHTEFLKHRATACPFDNLPLPHRSRFGQGMTPAVMKTVTWLKPRLVAQVKFAEWTHEGLLRQPVFLGLRHDKTATKVRREARAA